MCSIFIAVAGAAAELGVGEALIQKKDHKVVEKLYSTAFWTGIAWGLALFLFMSFVVGPFSAYFYNEPILIKLIPALSIGIFIRPFSMVHTVILTRKMDFKRIAKAYNLAGFLAGVISIAAAYVGYGVWALVINSVLAAVLALPVLFYSTKWIPTWEWKRTYFKQIFGFGAYSSATRVFSTLTYNIDNLMIGKMLGASFLGAYTLSFSLTENLRQMISSVLNKVMFPVFGQHQNDKLKLRSYFLKIVNINAMAIYPLMVFFLIFAREIIVGFFGSKWEMAVAPLQILSIAIMIHMLINSFTAIIRGLGKPELEMKIIMGLTLFVLIPSLFLGITLYGLSGAAGAIIVNKIMLAFIGIKVLGQEINVSPKDILTAVIKPIFAVLLCAILILLCYHVLNIQKILVLAPIYGILYLVLIYRMEKKVLLSLLNQVK